MGYPLMRSVHHAKRRNINPLAVGVARSLEPMKTPRRRFGIGPPYAPSCPLAGALWRFR